MGVLRETADGRKLALESKFGDLRSLGEEDGRHEEQERFCAPARCRPIRIREVVGWVAQLHALEVQTHGKGRLLRFSPLISRDRVPEHRHTRDVRQRFLQELQRLPVSSIWRRTTPVTLPPGFAKVAT